MSFSKIGGVLSFRKTLREVIVIKSFHAWEDGVSFFKIGGGIVIPQNLERGYCNLPKKKKKNT